MLFYVLFFSILTVQLDIPPTPQRTIPPDTIETTYINKNFTSQIPVSENNQIQLGEEIKQISGCRFTDLEIPNRMFFIRVINDSSIFDNIFERTSYQRNLCGCIWHNYNSPNKFNITNCKFIRIAGIGVDSSVLNINYITIGHIVFRDCEFIDCGEIGNDRPIVNILNKDSSIEFYNCNFSYENPQVSRVLELVSNEATFDNCRFDNCGTNCIDIGYTGDRYFYEIGSKIFQFTNNYVNSVNTRFINAPRINAKPNISNNVFENITLNDECFIYICHNQSEIEFINNKFINFLIQGTEKKRFRWISSLC